MVKLLIVAHPDDEILWFNPYYFDEIVIVYCHRHDKENFSQRRLKALSRHPLKDRIRLLALEEPGFWKDPSRSLQYAESKNLLLELLKTQYLHKSIDVVYTHNEVGEYGHDDHILVSQCVHQVFTDKYPIWMPINGINKESINHFPQIIHPIQLNSFKEIRQIYADNQVWTWNFTYLPKKMEVYYSRNMTQGDVTK